MKIPANGFTHAGKFHADDVFATALLQILRPDIKITRGFVVPDDFDGIVYDVGYGMFDHHQEPRECRPNGVPYAALGLLWRVLGAQLVGEHQARLLDENFIQPLDLNDNTGEQNSLCDAIGFFNPVWDSKEDQDACFFKAVAVAKQILENQIESANAVNRADEKVQQAYKNSRDGIVMLPCYLEERAVQDRRPFRHLSQPAGRLERPVRHRPQDQKAQAPLPPELGRPSAGGHRAEKRHRGHQLLPRQPLPYHGQGQGDGPRRLPSGAEEQWPHLRSRKRQLTSTWCAARAASSIPAGRTTRKPASRPIRAAKAQSIPAPIRHWALPTWKRVRTSLPPSGGKLHSKS